MINKEIRKSIDEVAKRYQGPERAWLQEMNPMAIKQIDGLEAKANAAALDNDLEGVKRILTAWSGLWKFWIAKFEKINGKGR